MAQIYLSTYPSLTGLIPPLRGGMKERYQHLQRALPSASGAERRKQG
ncbi:MAG: hypothetical protein ACNS64_12810 [Candidatus Halalkalibacterium sp. M3_1C_030]